MKRALALVLTLLSGPSAAAADGGPGASSEVRIAVLGGAESEDFCAGLRRAGVPGVTCAAAPDVASRSALIARADAVLLVVDATQGALPRQREDTQLARQFSRGPVLVAFARSAEIEDPELLELEELELRELLNAYDLGGADAEVLYDAADRGPSGARRGFAAIAARLRSVKQVPASAAESPSARALKGSLYVLVQEEAFRPELARTLDSGRYTLVFGARALEAEVRVGAPIQPGQDGDVQILLREPLSLGRGDHFVIGSPAHLVAAGVLY